MCNSKEIRHIMLLTLPSPCVTPKKQLETEEAVRNSQKQKKQFETKGTVRNKRNKRKEKTITFPKTPTIPPHPLIRPISLKRT